MNKKLITTLFLLVGFCHLDALYKGPYHFIAYMNDRPVTLKSLLLGSAATSLNHNILDNGKGQVGGEVRVYGIHDMWVQPSGYERVYLVKDDVCLYPNLFTVLGAVLPKNNMLTQRWACVKWCWPLSFDFNVVNDTLQISSTVFKYRFLTLYKAYNEIQLVSQEPRNANDEMTIMVSVNDRAVAVAPNKMVQAYSTSALHPLAVLARALFL